MVGIQRQHAHNLVQNDQKAKPRPRPTPKPKSKTKRRTLTDAAEAGRSRSNESKIQCAHTMLTIASDSDV